MAGADPFDVNKISFSASQCLLCGSDSVPVYTELQDYSFGTPGMWNIRRCIENTCGLAWCDPIVRPNEIHRFYQSYYTHRDTKVVPEAAGNIGNSSFFGKMNGLLQRSVGLSLARRRNDYMYLEHISPGTLLDVGCGDGSQMLRLQNIGWTVEGQEIDPTSADLARSTSGATVYVGELQTVDFGRKKYDAIILSHVLEHLHNPVQQVARCRDLLAKNGLLVIKVPNFNSERHRQFGAAWRGLEPPRHIYHYSYNSLHRLAEASGLPSPRIFTTSAYAEAFFHSSCLVQMGCENGANENLSVDMKRRALLAQYKSWLGHILSPRSGDECVLLWSARDQ